MILHYLKVAFRNMWKYRNQTLVSVAGLAVGFVCFAIAALWIRYEMTFDGFHKNADRMYCVSIPNSFSPIGMSRSCPSLLAGHLKATFPEIAHAVPILPLTSDEIESEGVLHTVDILDIDSSFFSMFDVKIIEGSMEFLIPENKKAAITGEKARQLFGKESPLGKIIKRYDEEYTVCAVVTGLPKRSNYPFDFLISFKKMLSITFGNHHTLVELLPGIDAETFGKKLYNHTVRGDYDRAITKMTLTPLTAIRYKDPNLQREVKFQHIIIFSVAGSLLVLCTLFNYLTVFVSRFRIRQRELALRIVCGASNRSLFTLLSVEFLMSLIIALLLGLVSINTIISPFRKLSGIQLELSSIYLESLVYIAGIILFALLAFLVVLTIFRHGTLNVAIRKGNKKPFRKISVAVQLIISIGFAFCTIVIVKQMYHLHETDLGFAFKNRGSVYVASKIDIKVLDSKIRQIPEITETVAGLQPLIPVSWRTGFSMENWDDKPEDAEPINVEMFNVSERFLEYYEIKLIEGEMLNDKDDETTLLINESAAKACGWHKSVGKTLNHRSKNHKVKGVIKNIYSSAPTIAAKPIVYKMPVWTDLSGKSTIETDPAILFKYNEGTWQTCRKKIETIFREEYPDITFTLSNTEEEYDKFLKSENTLLKLLMLISLVCVFICVFGFVSMVSLTCEERRKEIAIRKINGATIKDILDIFFREHLTLLAIGALIAFPAGYIIMKRWLEQYVIQTEMSAWIYAAILLALITVIVMCVGGRVYKTSRENPVDAINR